jgi:transcriptional regulator with XRE-family HTH domain
METFAKRVKDRRLELDLTQAQIAERSGIKQSDISKIENGKILQPAGILGLARALQCSPDWLATGEGEMIPQRIINRQQVGLDALAPVSIASVAIKEVADPLQSLRVTLEDIPAEYRKKAIHAAWVALSEWVIPELALAKISRQIADAGASKSEPPRTGPAKRKTPAT